MNLTPYGYQILGIISGGVTLAGGVWARRRYAKIDLEAKRETAALEAQVEPTRFLTQQLDKREAELKEAHADARQDRAQFYSALAAMKSGIDAIKVGIDAIVKRLDASTAESSANAKVTNERLLVIEVKLGIKGNP